MPLTTNDVRYKIADSPVIFSRGEALFALGAYERQEINPQQGIFRYLLKGSQTSYQVQVVWREGMPAPQTSCDCPYPRRGCKHVVAACLDLGRVLDELSLKKTGTAERAPVFLTPDQIREEALNARREAAKHEGLILQRDDSMRGEHRVAGQNGRTYTVILHDPATGEGHCTCPDYASNKLQTCKHLLFAAAALKREPDWAPSADSPLPFVHFFWNAFHEKPQVKWDERTLPAAQGLREELSLRFDEQGLFRDAGVESFPEFHRRWQDTEGLKFDERLMRHLNRILHKNELLRAAAAFQPDWSLVRATPYPYQKAGIEFGLFRKGCILADEMGLGKTLQALALAVLKKQAFGIRRVLVVTPASLKTQWHREAERFTGEKAVVVRGSARQRRETYQDDPSFFRITNYEAVLRDRELLKEFPHDLVILDEAQRIKNFQTKTHRAVMDLPHDQAVILTGTPLENRLEDLYSIVQFADPELLTPLWLFAANHYRIDPKSPSKPFAYHNLDQLHQRLSEVLIRRRKAEVFESLPKELTQTYRVALTPKQREMHDAAAASLAGLLGRKYLTPLEMEMIQKLLLTMRMVCDSSFLLDHETNDSPKLAELETVLRELVVENRRKVVLFTEWTTMAKLIAARLDQMGIGHVLFSGETAVDRRQTLIDRFQNQADCMVFLSTDAGGVGLNLQNADCVVNFELPWNPAKLAQRIGRVNRIGQTSSCINVVNFISENSIEENVSAGIALKEDLFHAALDGSASLVDMGTDRRREILQRLKDMTVPVAPKTGEPAPVEEQREAAAEEPAVNLGHEEDSEGETLSESPAAAVPAAPNQAQALQEVLENGLRFLSGLSVMAGGKPLAGADQPGAVSVDPATGEVVIRFKLPT